MIFTAVSGLRHVICEILSLIYSFFIKSIGKACNRIQFYHCALLSTVGKTIADVKGLRVNIKDFDEVKLIGQGHFGQVKVVKEKTTGEVYALKVIRKKDVLSHQEVTVFC